MRRIHPYALLFGIGIGIAVLFALRNPILALFASLVTLLGFDLAFRLNEPKDGDDDPGSEEE